MKLMKFPNVYSNEMHYFTCRSCRRYRGIRCDVDGHAWDMSHVCQRPSDYKWKRTRRNG